MFDWDKDLDGLYGRTTFETRAGNAVAVPRAPLNAWRVLAMTGVLCGAAFIAQDILHRGSAPASSRALSGLGLLATDLPDELHVYGAEQYSNFMRGIDRFNDAELTRHAQIIAEQLSAEGDLMRPYWRDALYLTNQELTRRGLITISEPFALDS